MTEGDWAGTYAWANEAAEQVFDSKRDDAGPSFEPSDVQEAGTAVQRLGELFGELPGAIAEALDAARNSGTLLASDRLHGLAEIVQNADDVEASEVRLLLRPADLLACHDGAPVCLPDVLGFATPWLSTKAGDAAAIGRFGVGLSTLRSLSTTLEVHCAPYHVRIGGDPLVAPVELPDVPPLFREPGWDHAADSPAARDAAIAGSRGLAQPLGRLRLAVPSPCGSRDPAGI